MKTTIKLLMLSLALVCGQLRPAKAQEIILPKWTAQLDGFILDASISADWLVVTTGSSIYILDPESGDVLDTFRTPGKVYPAVRRIASQGVVWAVEKPTSGWQGTRVVEIDPLGDSITRTIEFNTTPGPHPSCAVDNVKLDIAPDAREIAVLVSWGSDHYARLSDYGELHRLRLDSLSVVERSWSLNGWVVYHPTDGSLIIPGHTSSWSGDDYRGYSETRYNRTHVLHLRENSPIGRDTLSVNYRLGSNLKYLIGYGGPITWPDYQPIKNIALGKPHLGQDLIDFTLDACSQILVAPDPYDSIAADICELVSHDTLARLKAFTIGKNWRYLPLVRHHAILGTELDYVLHYWDISNVPRGRKGSTRIIDTAVTERTFIPIATPRVAPIDTPMEVFYRSIEDSIQNDIYFAENIGERRVLVFGEPLVGEPWVDTQRVEALPLLHDSRARRYWSTGGASGSAATMSLSGTFVGIAANTFSILIDQVSDAQQRRREPDQNTLRVAAVESDGSFYVAYDSVKSTGYKDRYSVETRVVRMRRYHPGDTLVDSKSVEYTAHVGAGYSNYSSVTKWREGFGCYVTNVEMTNYDMSGRWYNNPRALGNDPVHLDFCDTAPLVFDVDQKRSSHIFRGIHEQLGVQGDRNEWLIDLPGDTCTVLQGRVDRYATYAADGQYIVTDLGVYDREFNLITASEEFSNMPVDIAGTSNVISAKGKMLFLWTLPAVVAVDSVEMYDDVVQVFVDTSHDEMLVRYANRSIELYNRTSLFPLLDTLPVSVDRGDEDRDSTAQEVSTIEVYSILGKRVATDWTTFEQPIPLALLEECLRQQLLSGMYVAVVRLKNGAAIHKKILID